MEERSIRCVIPMSETMRKRLRNFYKKMVKSRYEYRGNRYKVERLFGNVKRMWCDRNRTRIYELARLFVMVRFVLWNLTMLLKLSFFVFSSIYYKIIVVCFALEFSNSLTIQ